MKVFWNTVDISHVLRQVPSTFGSGFFVSGFFLSSSSDDSSSEEEEDDDFFVST